MRTSFQQSLLQIVTMGAAGLITFAEDADGMGRFRSINPLSFINARTNLALRDAPAGLLWITARCGCGAYKCTVGMYLVHFDAF